MKHFFTRLGCAAAMAGTIFGVNAATDEAGNSFIYLGGMVASAPTTDNAEEWEAAKMPETAPGSNVYETTVNLSDMAWGAWFRFYYDLAAPEVGATSYRLKLIQPHADGNSSIDGVVPALAGNSGVFVDSHIDKLSASAQEGTWHLPFGTYKLRVDLNEKSFQAIPENTVVMLVNDDSDPSNGNPASFTEANRMKNYVEPCEKLEIRFYDLFNGQWLKPQNGAEVIEVQNGTGYAQYSGVSESKVEPFLINNWQGGVVSASYYYGSYKLSLASYVTAEYTHTPISPDQIYIIGDFNTWNEFVPVEKEAGERAIYKVTLPAGTELFKLLLADMWGADEIGVGDKVTSAGSDNVYELRIAEYGGLSNSTFTPALDAPATFVIDLTEGTITVSNEVAVNFAYVPVEGGVPPVNRDALFVETSYDAFAPWKDCSDAVLSVLPILEKQTDGTYSGSIYVPAGQFSLRFVSDLTDRTLPNMVIAPPTGADRALVVADKTAYSTAAELSADKAGFWTFKGTDDSVGWPGGYVDVTVTTGASASVKFDFSASIQDEDVAAIYLVGEPQGWDISSGSMPLKLTTTGGYYGAYPIDAQTSTFRFYTQLGDWGNDASLPSIGPDYYDGSVETVILSGNDKFYGNCVPGKGSWNIIGWTPGNTLYMYVNIKGGNVIFSPNPIAEAGNYVDSEDVKSVYLHQDGAYVKLTEKANGLFTGYLSGNSPFRLFTKILPISPEEADWGGSYALSIPSVAKSELSFDEFSVAELQVIANEERSTDGGTEFAIPSSNVGRFAISVDLEAGKVYVENTETVYYLCGGLTDGKTPTYSTRADFAPYCIASSGGIVDIPAGKFDFSFVQSIADSYIRPNNTDVTFTDGLAVCENGGIDWAYSNVVCSDWKGGKLVVCTDKMLNMSVVNEISAVTTKSEAWDEFTATLSETAPGSLVFEGTVQFADGVNPRLMFNLCSRNVGGRDVYFEILSAVYYSIFGVINAGEDVLIPVDGVMQGKVGVNTSTRLSMPSLTGDGTMDVTLDLNTLTIKAIVDKSHEGSVYETVANDDSGVDGVTAYMSANQPGVLVASANAVAGDDCAFNFTTPYGQVIQPASGADTPVEFDENGCWTGEYVKVSTPAKASRRVLRAAAAQSARWHLNMPENGSVNMLIDETNSTLTLFSTVHNRNYFIVPVIDYKAQGNIGVEYLGEMCRNLLKESSTGEHTGEITVPEDAENFSVIISSDCNLMSGLFTPVYPAAINLSEATEVAVAAVPNSWNASQWNIAAPAGKVALRYNSEEGLLYASRSSAGVENVTADRVEPTQEGIYTLSGVRLDVSPDRLLPGIYIINGKKTCVR